MPVQITSGGAVKIDPATGKVQTISGVCPSAEVCAIGVEFSGISFDCGCIDLSDFSGAFIITSDVAVAGTYAAAAGLDNSFATFSVARFHTQSWADGLGCSGGTFSEGDYDQELFAFCDPATGTFTVLLWNTGYLGATFYATGVRLDTPANNQLSCGGTVTLPLDTPPHSYGGPSAVRGVAHGGTVTLRSYPAKLNYSYTITSPGFGPSCGDGTEFSDSGTITGVGLFPWYPNTNPSSGFTQDPTILGPCQNIDTPCRGPVNCAGTDYYFNLRISPFWDEGSSCWKTDFLFFWWTCASPPVGGDCSSCAYAFSVSLNEEQTCLSAHDIRVAGAHTNVVDYGTYSANISVEFVAA